MVAKKSSKIKIEAELAEIKHEHKHEDIKTFLKRKLVTFGKYKQTSVVLLRPCYDPVRCTLCNRIVFFTADIDYEDDFTHKDVQIKKVCADCLHDAHVINLTPKELSNVSKDVKLTANLDEALIGEEFSGDCSCCSTKAIVKPYWTYYSGIPIKLCYCEDCAPKPTVQEVVVADVKTVLKAKNQEKDFSDMKAFMEED